ncbi:ComF family protein [Mesobacillus foraminis]|uniref:ComF family protein n=1 Tax=Mesobacillus foraminis TaxID=279826 RepID=UPI000EF4A79C|nr:ComF family protein [Mesobacillus foraminis]
MNWLASEHCLFCHGKLETAASWRSVFLKTEREYICGNCKNRLEPLKGDTCRICSKVLEAEFRKGSLCYDCIRWEEDPHWSGLLTQNISLYHYNDFLKEIIARFKYRGDYVLARGFMPDVASALKSMLFDCLVPIPLSQERQYERGFNQTEALILESGHQPTPLLSRIHTEKQSKKSRTDRIHLSQIFQLIPEKIPDINGKTILLFDDIYTTGSTLRHASKILKENGAGSIYSLTLAR